MYLRTQTEEAIVDLEKVSSVVAEDGTIYLNIFSDGSMIAGKYKSQERAKEIVGEIYALLDVTSRYDMPVI